MAITLINLTGFTRGILSNEVGINCSKFSLEVEPEVNEWLPGITGEATGKVVGQPCGKLSIEGEIGTPNGTAGTGTSVMVAAFGTAYTPSNATNFFGLTAGGFYLTRGTVDQERDGWRKVSAEFETKPNVP